MFILIYPKNRKNSKTPKTFCHTIEIKFYRHRHQMYPSGQKNSPYQAGTASSYGALPYRLSTHGRGQGIYS